MATTYTQISIEEMDGVLRNHKFIPVDVPGTREIVYSKLVGKNLCMRVWTSIVYGVSRGVGEDAIRVALVYRRSNGEIKGCGKTKRVYRIETWKENLEKRLAAWEELKSPECPTCNAPMVSRKSKHGPFWGCCEYPVCSGLRRIE